MRASRTERRLAAVLAADVAGYSRLMERDEARTLSRLKAHRAELIAPLLADYRGRLVKLMGDGLLCEFASVVDAVECAVRIQRGLEQRESSTSADDRIRLRIGVNLGDVICEPDGDIYGGGVNVASRLEGLAEPGGITVSGTAFDHLQGKLDCAITPLGERQLKNIAQPVRLYRIEVGAGGPGGAAPEPSAMRPAAPPSIAVLPFVNLSGDPAQGYFSDGVTEDIITELSRFRPLAVIARTSSFQFRNKEMPVQAIGSALKADFIVEGSVRRLGERLRITGQLIEASTGRHLWAERYDREAAELFAVQDEVVRSVAYTVATRLSRELRETARRKRPEDLGAYDCFLRANHLMDGSPEEQAEAVALYERARAIDPGFARAYTGLVWARMMRSFGPMPHAASAALLEEAHQLAEQGLAVDPDDARVYFAAGWVCLFRHEFERARFNLDRARELNGNDPMILVTWAWVRACLGEPEEALVAASEAMRLDPWIHWYPARIEFLARNHALALVHLEACATTGPRWSAWRAAALGHLDRLEEARAEGQRFVQSTAAQWQGAPPANADGCCAWILDTTPLRLAADREHLRQGLRLAGLPA